MILSWDFSVRNLVWMCATYRHTVLLSSLCAITVSSHGETQIKTENDLKSQKLIAALPRQQFHISTILRLVYRRGFQPRASVTHLTHRPFVFLSRSQSPSETAFKFTRSLFFTWICTKLHSLINTCPLNKNKILSCTIKESGKKRIPGSTPWYVLFCVIL